MPLSFWLDISFDIQSGRTYKHSQEEILIAQEMWNYVAPHLYGSSITAKLWWQLAHAKYAPGMDNLERVDKIQEVIFASFYQTGVDGAELWVVAKDLSQEMSSGLNHPAI